MSCCDCARATALHFGAALAERDLARYRRRGPQRTTRLLLSGLARAGGGATVLDIGSGVGALGLELLAAGAERATLVDLSPAYLEAARAEAERRGLAARVTTVAGDFAALADGLEAADLVALDRVVCCYPDHAALLRLAAGRCRALLAFTWPRDRWPVRTTMGLENLRRRLRGDPFRTFVHPPAGMEDVLSGARLERVSRERTFVWCADVYRR